MGMGSQQQSNRFVYNMDQQGSGVSCQFASSQPNEYVLTSVGGNGGGMTGGGGGFGSGGGGFGTNKGLDSWEQDAGGSLMSGSNRSAVIDIGHGVRNSFYPSLPNYDD